MAERDKQINTLRLSTEQKEINKNVQFDPDHSGMLKMWADFGEDSVKTVFKMTMFQVWQLMWHKPARDWCQFIMKLFELL